jgi:hypothetical protein
MGDWYCFKDKVTMVEANLTLSYMMLTRKVPGLQCPECGAGYLTEKTVTTLVKEAESILENKKVCL